MEKFDTDKIKNLDFSDLLTKESIEKMEKENQAILDSTKISEESWNIRFTI